MEQVIKQDGSVHADVTTAIQAHLQRLFNVFYGYFSTDNMEAKNLHQDNEPVSVSVNPNVDYLKEEINTTQYNIAQHAPHS